MVILVGAELLLFALGGLWMAGVAILVLVRSLRDWARARRRAVEASRGESSAAR